MELRFEGEQISNGLDTLKSGECFTTSAFHHKYKGKVSMLVEHDMKHARFIDLKTGQIRAWRAEGYSVRKVKITETVSYVK